MASEEQLAPFDGFLNPLEEFDEPADDTSKLNSSRNPSASGSGRKRSRQTANMSSVLKCLLGEGIVVELKNDSGMS